MTARRTAIQSLTEAVMSFQLETIPEDVLGLAKRCLVDVCAVTLAGSKTESAKLLFATAAETYGMGNCDIVGTSNSLNAPGAAFVNGNPFGQPGQLISNIEGEGNPIGIFTSISVDTTFTIIPE